MTTPSLETTPEQRMTEIAAILAQGALRLKQDAQRNQASPPKEVRESSQDCLDPGADLRLSGSPCSGV
jgi:hypothetical protein